MMLRLLRDPHPLMIVALALAGALVSWRAMTHWTPDAAVDIPRRGQVLERAFEDAEKLGYRVGDRLSLSLSAGSRVISSLNDQQILVENEPDIALRRRLRRAAPPIRLGVRFFDAIGPEEMANTLLLEYGGDAELVAAAFAPDIFSIVGNLSPTSRTAPAKFADQVAEMLLGRKPPKPEETRQGDTMERVYRLGDEEPGAYVSISASVRWLAHRQPFAMPMLSYSAQRFASVAERIRFYGLIVAGLLALGVLLWRLTRRRAGFGRGYVLAGVLGLSFLPALHFLSEPHIPLWVWLYYILSQLGVYLVWTAGEAELREVHAGATEHYDRLLSRLPTAATGHELLAGFALGWVVCAIRSSGGALASLFGGGYNNVMTILPDQWTFGSPLSQGLALAAGTSVLAGFGKRMWGRPGAALGIVLNAACWSQAIWVVPMGWSLLLGLLASLVSTWVLWRYGLLALAVTCMTAFAFPTAWVGWSAFPVQATITVVASLPILAPLAGLVLAWRAPQRRDNDAIAPSWVSDLRKSVRLDAEVELLREMQLLLLPPESLGRVAGAEIAWNMTPADTVGGDFLDVVEDSAGRLWITVADVAGHGIGCSILTAYTKAAVVEHASAEATPATALAGIRSLFARLRGPATSPVNRSHRRMVTLLLVLWDPARRELSVASAGHLPLLVASGDGVRELGCPGPPLGVDLKSDDEDERLHCPDPAVLVGYSDGVVESVSPSGELFGYERWPKALAELTDKDPRAVLEELLGDVECHRAGGAPGDDVTAVVVRLPPDINVQAMNNAL